MAAPTLVTSAETVFNASTDPKTTGNLTTTTDDILVCGAVVENGTNTWALSGGSLTYTLQKEEDAASYCNVIGYTAPEAGAGSTFGVQFNPALGDTAWWWGGKVYQFRDSDGVGASGNNSGSSGAPSVTLTTTQADSAIVVIIGDWNAVSGTVTWLTVGDAVADVEDFRDASHYRLFMAVYPNVGTAGSKTVGMSAPTGQKWRAVAIEIKGTAGGGGGGNPWNYYQQAG